MSLLAGLPGNLLRGFLDLLFAPVCLGCGEGIAAGAQERRVCGVCWSRIRELPHPRCERCWTPLPAAPAGPVARRSCAVCELLPPSLRALRSACVLEGPARRLVHALKYGGWHGLGESLGGRMAALRFPQEAEEEIRVVLPVPLSGVRMRQRGYNQAEALAREVARRRGWTCDPGVLERPRSTETQTHLHPVERRANVAGAFRVRPGRADGLRGEHLLLVDDVWTTGATCLACCETLIRAGARAVSVLTFARALPDLHR